jgi:hypothetical protein
MPILCYLGAMQLSYLESECNQQSPLVWVRYLFQAGGVEAVLELVLLADNPLLELHTMLLSNLSRLEVQFRGVYTQSDPIPIEGAAL